MFSHVFIFDILFLFFRFLYFCISLSIQNQQFHSQILQGAVLLVKNKSFADFNELKVDGVTVEQVIESDLLLTDEFS